MPLHLVFMGVSGAGKSTVGKRVAGELGLAFAEGDEFHSRANLEKMRQGTPLTDEDRWPWLEALAEWTRVRDEAGQGTAMACSALRRAYRDRLRRGAPAFFVHLAGAEPLISERMAGRSHFMPPALLRSQLDTLEPLQPDEDGIVVDIARPLPEIVAAIVARFAPTA